MKYYHQPGDEADENFDFDYLLTFCRAYVRTARRIADNPIRPRWVEGDEFEATWKRLYERDGKPADQNE